MSESEQAQFIGKLTLDYAEAKKRREMLKEKLKSCGVELARIAEHLRSGGFENSLQQIDSTFTSEFGLNWILNLLNEFRTEKAKAQELRDSLHRAGIYIE